MKKRDEILKVLLCVLIAVFVIVSAAALLLVGFRSSAIKEQKKQAAMEALKNRPTAVSYTHLNEQVPEVTAEIKKGAFLKLKGVTTIDRFDSELDVYKRQTQIEAAAGLGMNPCLIMREVIFPQALAVSIPGVCANVIFLIKETSVVSGIALEDLMYVTKDLIGLYYETNEALVMLVLFYLILLLPVSIAAGLMERRLKYAGFGD